jgi:hypothetical protein
MYLQVREMGRGSLQWHTREAALKPDIALLHRSWPEVGC